MHDLHCVDMVIFCVACNINGREATPSSLVDKFISTFEDTTYHVTVHHATPN